MVAVLRQQRLQQAYTMKSEIRQYTPGPHVAESLHSSCDRALAIEGQVDPHDAGSIPEQETVVWRFGFPRHRHRPNPGRCGYPVIEVCVQEFRCRVNVRVCD